MSKHTPQQLRAVLVRLGQGAPNRSGPLTGGLRDSDPIVVASFYSPYVCQRFRRALTAAGVTSSIRTEGNKTSVDVSYGDRDTATQILAQQQSEDPDQRPGGIRRDFDFTLLGGVLGTTVTFLTYGFSPYVFVRVLACAGCIASGMTIGYVVDRFRRSFRYLGHVQFGMTDCFLLISAASLIFAFWAFLLRI